MLRSSNKGFHSRVGVAFSTRHDSTSSRRRYTPPKADGTKGCARPTAIVGLGLKHKLREKLCADDIDWRFKTDAQDCTWTKGNSWKCGRSQGNVMGAPTGDDACPMSCGTCPTGLKAGLEVGSGVIVASDDAASDAGFETSFLPMTLYVHR
jgi:hypothetical protein